MTKVYISLDLGTDSSGGIATNRELEAMKVIDNDVKQLEYNDIHPVIYGLINHPFLIDYLTMERVVHLDTTKTDMAHFYSGCFTNSIRYLKTSRANFD